MPGPGDPPKEYQFKPGQSGNPAGMKPNPFKKYTTAYIAEVFNDMMELSAKELSAIRGNETETGIRCAIAAVLLKCRSKGEFYDFNEMLNRVIGKVPQKTELTGGDGVPIAPPMINLLPVRPASMPEAGNARKP